MGWDVRVEWFGEVRDAGAVGGFEGTVGGGVGDVGGVGGAAAESGVGDCEVFGIGGGLSAGDEGAG